MRYVPTILLRRNQGAAAAIGLVALSLVGLGFKNSVAQEPPAEPQKLASFVETLPNSAVRIQMIAIPGGTIKMGTRSITVKPFWIAKTETPWEAFDAFTASGKPSPAYDQTEFPADAVARPSKSYILPDLGWGHNGYPAMNLSFTSVEMFCRWLAATTKKKYRLPTEEEWEFVCRDGLGGNFKWDKALVDKLAWHAGNAKGVTHSIGKKLPNKFGVYDLFGNAGEWGTDTKGEPVLCGGTFQDPATAMVPTTRRRWAPKWQETDPQMPKSRWWLSDAPFAGFRLVCEP